MFNQIEKWHQDKLGKFSGSKISELVGFKGTTKAGFSKGGYTYIDKVMAEILTGEKADDLTGLRAVEWGNANEYDAAVTAQSKGLKFKYYGGDDPQFFQFSEYSGCSPDGVGKDFIIEIKCKNSSEHINLTMLNDGQELKKYDAKIYWQIVFNSIVCKKKYGYLISYDPRFLIPEHRCFILKVVPPQDDVEFIKQRVKDAEITLIERLKVFVNKFKEE